MKRMELLGLSLTDYTLREALKLSNQYLYNGSLNTISYISTQILVEAGENPEQKDWLEAMDMTICGEVDILRAADLATRNRIREVENDEFLREFIHKLSRNKRKVFLISSNKEEVEKLQQYLSYYSNDLIVVGCFYVDDYEEAGMYGKLVNEINDVVPNVIISRLPYPMQERIMFDNKKFVNGDIWLALLDHANLHTHKRNIFLMMSQWIYRKIFRNKVNKEKCEVYSP